jgi:predicted sulfurtransferase
MNLEVWCVVSNFHFPIVCPLIQQQVLLFYRYFAAPPSLQCHLENGPSELAVFHTNLTERLHLGGKIRVGVEGFNVTVGGTQHEIESYMKECLSHWSFSGLDLDTLEKQRSFFKPTPGGCACVFGSTPASVRITAEITPMGVTNYIPSNWDAIESLAPAEFHARCWESKSKVLVDVRNHYESRIGYFVDPTTGEKALRPEIRRFSQWPQYVKAHMKELEPMDEGSSRQIMTYCTGGIRCEKGVRWMADKMEMREGDKICTLKGGIAAYLMWMDDEIHQGRKQPAESLFLGKNYVFDARGSTGLVDGELEPVSSCHICGVLSDRLSKCRSRGCHLILVVCSACDDTKDPRCCQNCLELEMQGSNENSREGPRPICKCERERESHLWEETRRLKTQKFDIRIKTID